MNSFSPVKAGLAGYGLILKRPVSALVWYLILLAFFVLYNAMGTYMAGEAFQALAQIQSATREAAATGAPRPDPTTMLQLVGQTSGFSSIKALLQLVVSILLACAVVRAMVRPKPVGAAYLRLSGDELRVAVTMIVLFVITIGVVLVTALLAGLLAAITAGVGGRQLAVIGGGIGGLIGLAALVFVTVKLSFAIPATMALKQINIFSSWSLTKGRFWKILVAYLIALLAMAPVIGGAIFAAATTALNAGLVEGPQDINAYLSYPPFTPEDLFSTPRLVTYVALSLVSMVVTVVLYALPTSIYEQIGGEAGGMVVSTDDDDDEDWDDED